MAFSVQLTQIPKLAELAAFPDSRIIRWRKAASVRCSAAPPSANIENDDFDPKSFRKSLTRSDNYNRKGFGHKEETLQLMNREYTSNNLFINSIFKSIPCQFFMKRI
ncbi:hypothetical protein LIER_42699 [Lithospermum erythrorhizon]|uniref:Uncharacterized protein n=1 Tax=Lithospermum erythrorhizon TaxID=34254 RepID=A0AAV3NUF5_LITER